MKSFTAVVSVAAMFIGPSIAVSAPSYGGHTEQTIEAMGVFCDQAVKDSIALNEPMTGDLLKLCTQ